MKLSLVTLNYVITSAIALHTVPLHLTVNRWLGGFIERKGRKEEKIVEDWDKKIWLFKYIFELRKPTWLFCSYKTAANHLKAGRGKSYVYPPGWIDWLFLTRGQWLWDSNIKFPKFL